MVICECGAEIPLESGGACLCAACLLRGALAPKSLSVSDVDAPARVVGPVGRGPRGVVHLAVRPDDDPQLVTVKVIEVPTDVKCFLERVTETASLLDLLRHPCIPEVLQIGTTGSGQPYIVASYVPGPSLRDYLRAKTIEVADRARLAGRLCSAVADLHDRRIVHGSLKPTNIIVGESQDGPMPFLLDTGIVPALEHASGTCTGADGERDNLDLHALVGLVLGELMGMVEVKGSAAALAEMFTRRAG